MDQPLFSVYQPDRSANAGLPGFFSCSLRSRCLNLCNSRLSSFNFVQDSWTWLQVHLLAPYHIVWPVPGVSPLLDAGAALL
ncbi:hypothetical protein Y032_0030g2090 [Ancylostoma ceylanicum]|uniref:Uncharacterized protein n=1 Tax=Ancylostoma ceylanicum TaxID=53326 RepID=A0A016URG1_9BILA|nr:hypothetical protein Y032_0030g2090 [Ancylostoma ceylanicum]